MNSQPLMKVWATLSLVFALVHVSMAQSAKESHPDMSYLKSASRASAAKAAPLITAEGYFDNLEAARKAPTKVVRLNLQGHALKSIPADLCMFPNLQELDLSNNAIKSLEVGFSCPTALKRLYLNGNEIVVLPAKLAQLTQLQVLVAYDNPITQIDAAIGGMHSLKELWLSGNGNIASLQPAIWNLKGLETLRLWHFGLTQVPDAIGQMLKLKTLCLQDNQITSLNPKACALPVLNYLNLGKNRLTALPAEIRQCTRLGYLGIYENPIATLPQDFALLSKTLERISAWQTGLPLSLQSQIKGSFPNTALMFEAIDLH
jgi:Leucine-rich repeat (LRR) protein